MEALVKAATDFLAAVLSTFGFIGRPRRRAAISDDLRLLHELRDSPAFGPESPAHSFLAHHITVEVAKFSGAEMVRKKQIPWLGVIIAALFGGVLTYWTYALDRDGFRWWSLLPGVFAALMWIAVLGMVFGEQTQAADEEEQAQRGEAKTK